MSNSGLSLQLSTRRLAPKRQNLKGTLVVLSPESRERINNEVRGRVSEHGLHLPAISPAHYYSPSTTRANVRRYQFSHPPQIPLSPRFNEPLLSPRPKKAPSKTGASEPLPQRAIKKLVCSKVCQTDFPLEGCEPWTVTELDEAVLYAWRAD